MTDGGAQQTVTRIELVNYDQWLNAYMMAPRTAIAPMKRAMQRSTLLVVGYLRVSGYPPEVPGNMPGRTKVVTHKDGTISEEPMGYYERGRGAWYPVKRQFTLMGEVVGQKLGKTRGRVRASAALRKAGIVYGYKLAKNKNGQPGTSEKLGQSWTEDVLETDGGVEGVLGTDTSYADWVQGKNQALQHKESGWITVSGALELSRDGINAAFAEAAREVIMRVVKDGSG